MLKRTFLHLTGVGEKTEKELWGKGIDCWEKYLLNCPDHHQEEVENSIVALKNNELDFFTNRLPSREYWRAYKYFPKIAFLDIETTGFSKYFDDLTLIGVYDGQDYHPFILGDNQNEFEDYLQGFDLAVTFNGLLFDVPFIKAKFPRFESPAQIDLRFLLKRLGYSGGLKNIERELGIERPEEVKNVSGYEAVILWEKYRRGDLGALEKLIKYNYEDTANLQKLMDFAYQNLAASHFAKIEEGKRTYPKTTLSGRGALTIGNTQLELKKAREKKRIKLSALTKSMDDPKVKVVGIDLTGSEKRATGWALMEGGTLTTKLLKTDKELVEETLKSGAKLVSIDSPLSLPKGRKGVSDDLPCRKFGISRECERQLKRAGISVFWCLLPSMQSLTKRGIKLAKEFKKAGVEVIESFPGAAQDILNIPRKKTGLHELKEGLIDFGLKGEFTKIEVSHDELDAITSALVGYFYLSGHFEALGNEVEDYLIIPSLAKLNGQKTLKAFLNLSS
jgi:uncharacterized protein YprB with RNaseH-like and TPR domain/predicted nuclease with RNAse H fold